MGTRASPDADDDKQFISSTLNPTGLCGISYRISVTTSTEVKIFWSGLKEVREEHV